ncbi:MAG: acyl-ACP--UDP-N-acetylglucosamine O-acyltransferase [Pseudomonadales bacterium]
MIHPTAIIDPSCDIADSAEIGPYTVVGPNVTIGEGTVIAPHVVIKGPTVIGAHNKIFQFSSVGEDTPDMKYDGEPTRLVIGDHNVIREGVTIHRGTIQDNGETIIGDHNLLMAYVHVGHDCVIGNHTIFVNNGSIAGHVRVGDWAIVSGYALIHQFCNIGAHSFVGMASWIKMDVPAYMTVMGTPAEAKGINTEGLRRRGFSAEGIAAIKQAYKIVYRRGLTVEQALLKLAELELEHPEVALFRQNIADSSRGIVR